MRFRSSAAGVYHDAQLFSYSDRGRQLGSDMITTKTRQPKVAVLDVGSGKACKTNFSWCMELLDTATVGVDLVVLPENFAGRQPEPIPQAGTSNGTVAAVSHIARRRKVYVIFGMYERASGGNKTFNSAVCVGRDGTVISVYRKVFPVFGAPNSGDGGETGVSPSQNGVGVFDLDFGRVAVLICFDINFAELWLQARAAGAELVVWPTAMATPDPYAHAYAALHGYYIVCAGSPGNVVDVRGRSVLADARTANAATFTIDLDVALVRWESYAGGSSNQVKVQQLIEQYANDLLMVDAGPPFMLLKSKRPGQVSVHQLLRAHSIETLQAYQDRSRRALNSVRQAGGTVP